MSSAGGGGGGGGGGTSPSRGPLCSVDSDSELDESDPELDVSDECPAAGAASMGASGGTSARAAAGPGLPELRRLAAGL
jgi:hypothetical protein